MSDIQVTSQLVGGEALRVRAERIFALMSLKNKARYNYHLAQKVGRIARLHIKEQTGIDGKRWAPRKRDPSKKLLKTMGRKKELITFSNASGATITYRNTKRGRKARMNQEGITLNMQAKTREEMIADLRKMVQTGFGDGVADPATSRQIGALFAIGADIPALQSHVNGLNWLRAGVIIKSMRRRAAGGGSYAKVRKRNWKILYPARSFLGLTPEEAMQVGDDLLVKMLEDVKQGRV
jgi:phage gpG-like protein